MIKALKNKYYRVHKNSLKFIPKITNLFLLTTTNVCKEYNGRKYNGYVYITFNEDGTYGFMPDEKDSISYFKKFDYEYGGEIDIRKERKNKLNKIYGN